MCPSDYFLLLLLQMAMRTNYSACVQVKMLLLSIWAFVLFLHQGLSSLLSFLERKITAKAPYVEVKAPLSDLRRESASPTLPDSLPHDTRRADPIVRDSIRKWYAVRKGSEPGIYTSWLECERVVKGYRGAQFKGFRTLEEAEMYMRGKSEV